MFLHVMSLLKRGDHKGTPLQPHKTSLNPFFKRGTVNEETQTVEWPNGADFAPEFLYEIGVALVEEMETAVTI